MSAYEVLKTLFESPAVRVRRGRRGDGKVVILKWLAADAGPQAHRRFRHEYKLLSRIDLPGVIKVFGLAEADGGLEMVLEDVGGQSLERLLASGEKLPLEQFLDLAAGLATTLAGLHRQRIVHKDINPAHIVVNSASGQFRLIGFGIADELPQSEVALQPPTAIEGNLAYIAPEQTGRMNRRVDYRSDYYSLGATFYRLLVGRPPFTTDDDLGLLHCHIAQEPAAPQALDPDLPVTLSRIVMKLLAKAAEDRYQSAYGLQADLDRCLLGLQSEGRIPQFALGKADVPDRLRMPERLYGREEEIRELVAAFNRASGDSSELLLVAGYAGVGKTALVREVHKHMLERCAFFIEGKFDQLQRHVPYSAWIHAFAGFVNYVLMEADAQLSEWQRTIVHAVGSLGRVLIEVVPNLELVIGEQPEVPVLGAAEAQNRFNHLFLQLVRAITTPEHPLVIFLDDLQWIDAASLGLMNTLLRTGGASGLLVIGAFRDNEVDALHPLTKGLDTLRREQARISQITLRNISETHVNELIADTLHCDHARSMPLTRLIHAKTGGNPFFMRQTLPALAERQAISFDPERRWWQWDIAAIEGMDITDNVAVLMLGKIRQLPRETQDLLPLAACIGFRFDLTTLCAVAGRSAESILNGLQPALGEGLMVADAEHHYRFVHDRVLEAAYTLLPGQERPAVHWRIGQRLLREMTPAERGGHLFDIVHQLNIGAACLTTPEEAKALADLNRQAGRKAKAGAAFLAALEYFEAGLALMDDNDWETAYELTIALHTEAAEAACLCGRYERMEALVLLVQQRSRSILDTVPVYGTQIRALTAQGRLVPAIRSGLNALERLGMRLPEEPSAAEVNEAMARAYALLQQRTIEGLIDLPPMTAPEQLASLSLLSEIGEPAYAASPQFFLVWASSMAELSLRHGNCPLSPFAYSAYALALCATGEIETGSLLSKAAIALIDALKAHSLRCRLLNIHGCTIQPWTEPLRDTLSTLTEAVAAGAESGDFTSGSYAAFNACTAAFFMGEPLEELGVRVSTNLKIIAGLRQTYIWNWVAFHVPVIRRLHGGENVPARPDDFDEASWLIAARDAKDRCGLAYYFLGRLIAAYLLDDLDLAETRVHIAAIKENMAGFQGAFAVPVFSFYCALTLLKQHGVPQAEKDAASFEEVRAHLTKLEALSRYAPMNFRHKCDLIAAELARLQGEDWRAAGLYEKAIAGARDNGFLQEEALANELAAKFYLAHGREEYARQHLDKAQRGYSCWQAFAKVRALEAEYPQWLKRVDSRPPAPETHSLDMESILKATHAISGEIEMGRVLGKIMHIVIENAGAQTGFLLMESDGAWTVAARGEIGRSDVEIPIPEAVDDSDAVCAGVIHFVARTRKTVVLDDAATRGAFVDDPHIRREKTRSLLVTPLSNRGRLLAILYLVNNLATHTFTPERIQLLEVLSTQAAITLETAGAYEALRASEEKYRTLIQKLRAAVVVHAADTRIVTCNPVAQTLLGLTEDQLLGKTGIDPAWHFYREDGTEMPQAEYPVNQVLATRQPLVNLVVGVHRPGNEQDVWAMVNANPVFGPKNEISEIIVTFIDITERKQAQEKLVKERALLRCLIDSVSDLIFIKDKNGVYQGCNKASEAFIGMPEGEQIGKTDFDFFDFERAEEIWKADSQMLEEGKPLRIEEWVTGRDGRHLLMDTLKAPYYDPDGETLGLVGIGRDITERKLAEDKRQESEERLRLTLEATQIGIFDWDVAHDIWRASSEYYTMLGYAPTEGIGDRQEWQARVHPDDRAYVEAKIREVLAGDSSADSSRTYAYEARIRHADGSYRWQHVKGFGVKRDRQGRVTRMLGIRMDITERKAAEEALRRLNTELDRRVLERTAQLEAANKELEAFAYSVSHDLRAPLRHIDGFLELLQKKAGAALDDQSRHYMDTISDSAKKMGRLIDDLIAFSRMGRHALSFQAVALGDLVREVIRELAPDTAGREIDWRVGDLPAVNGDAAMLRMVLVNLIANALKFTRPRRQARIEIGSQPGQASEAVIFVRDNGVGFDMTYAGKLFGVFQRLHRAEEFEGTGIGLANVHRIIARHGGRTWAEGKVNQGAALFFSLPHIPRRGGDEKP